MADLRTLYMEEPQALKKIDKYESQIESSRDAIAKGINTISLIKHPLDKTKPGEHIGLSIMQERAERLGCRLRIESDPGDGTRVDLTFEVADTAAPEILTRVN